MKPVRNDPDLADTLRANRAATFVVAAFVITAACVCALVAIVNL